MKTRKVLYTIGATKAKEQMKSRAHIIGRAEGTRENGDWYYYIWFGVDDKGRKYMVLADKVEGSYWRGAHRSCGHWHSGGTQTYTKYWNIYLRKNFKDTEEANRYWTIVNNNMVEWHVDDNKEFTEEQFDRLFK